MRRWTLPSLLLLAAAALPLAGREDKPTGKKFALLVGVCEYNHDKLKDLKYTENDVEELARILRDNSAGFEVTLLTTTRGKKDESAQPTAKNIRVQLKRILAKRTKHDTVLVALSGHGILRTVEDPKGKKADWDESFFCPSDAKWPRDTKKLEKLSEALIGMTDLFAQLEDSGVGARLLLVDCCRHELPAAEKSLDTNYLPKPASGTVALFSCSKGQKSYETEKLGSGHGVFFHFVLDGLRGKAKNDDGEVTWDDLVAYVKRRVPKVVIKVVGDGAQQSPVNLGEMANAPVLVGKAGLGQTVLGPQQEVTNLAGMKLKLIPAGTFTMGSPEGEADRRVDEDAHKVRITKAFYVGAHTVTVGQFRRFVQEESYRTQAEKGKGGFGYNGGMKCFEGPKRIYSWKRTGWRQTEKHPVVNVSWHDAVAFCAWLNEADKKMPKGWGYRLPTEAEWEYACRAGSASRYHFGNDARELPKYANVADLSLRRLLEGEPYDRWDYARWNDRHPFTAPVGSYKPNKFGLFDMHGNVYQWCADWYGKDYYLQSPDEDPKGPDTEGHRVLRGGPWKEGAKACRSAGRGGYLPTGYDFDIGFRVVLAPATTP
jgi:formylglycine-generating enzyme required for sulfatase activity